MRNLDKRVAALETAWGGTLYQLTDSQLMAVIERGFIATGTTLAGQVCKFGSLQAVLVAVAHE